MELKIVCPSNKVLRNTIKNVYQTISYAFYSNSLDAYIDSLVIEKGSKKQMSLHKYFESSSKNSSTLNVKNSVMVNPNLEKWNTYRVENNTDLISKIEYEMREETTIPNKKLYYILTYYVKCGDISGVKTIQLIIEKYNSTHFRLHSEYKHYMAEAMWINGKIEDSFELFSIAYNNVLIRPQVIVMLKCLFPLLISRHSEVLLNKIVCLVEKFSVENNDFTILAFVWKELFQSDWFSDQELSRDLVQRNVKLRSVIHFIIPSMGKTLLKEHNLDTFYRLFEFTLKHELNQDGILLRFLFDYYCKYFVIYLVLLYPTKCYYL